MSFEPQEQAVPVLAAWSEALPRVLALLSEQQRGPFRHELQRYLAAVRFQPNDVREHSEHLKGLLIEAARAASQPAAISTTRDLDDAAQIAKLCEHLLAGWRDAEQASRQGGSCGSADGMTGKVFFGPRLGGTGRPGAMTRPTGADPNGAPAPAEAADDAPAAKDLPPALDDEPPFT